GLVSGGTRLVQTSTSFPTRAAQDAVQIASGSVRPDPAQPLQAGEESAAEARVQYVLQTKADARLVLGIYPSAQGGTAIASSPPAPVFRTDPANSSKQLATAKFTIPKEAKELYLRAALLDGSDAVISESPAVRFTVNPPPEIGISSIEAVQAVQVAAPGEVPLVLGRPTVVRVFVQQKGRPDNLVAGITGTLQVNAGESSCTVAPRSSVSAHMAPDRNEGSHSLNFPIPASCLGSGGADVPVRYEAKLELEPGNKEIVEFKDNPKEYRSTLQSTVGADAPLRVRYQKVCLKTSSNCPSGSFGGDAGQYIESLLPFQPNGLSLARSSAADAFYPQDLDDADPSRQAVKISAFRMWLRRQYRDLEEAGGDVPDMLIGLVPDILGLPTGEADPAHGKIGGKGRVAFVMDHVSPQRRNYYLAHELGHNLGLRHTNTDDGCPAKAADTETNWPYSNGTINGVGWDHQSHTVIPSSRFDLMTYCVPSSRIWISPFGFNQVFQQLRNWRSAKAFIALPKYSIPNPRPAAAADYLFMAGSVRRDGSAGTLQRGYTAASALPGDEPDAQSRHCLVFSGASGGELSRHCFPLSFDNSETGIPLDENFFEVKVPLPGGAARLDLAVSGRTLAAFPIPAAAPTVSFVSPQPGEKWSGRRTLSWTASDPAGGRLGYKVSYSADDGATWVPLAFDIESTELTVDTGLLAGGARVWFRVQASGGVRTGEGRTGPIEIAVNPVLEPSRDRIEFGAVAPGAVREEALEIRATGSGPVRVTAIRTGSEEFLASAAPLPFTVPAGGSARVAVRFAPRQSGSSSSQLEIESDSPLKPVLSIPLEGGMADAEQPRLVLGDDSIDFGAVPAGGALTLPLELRNAGAAALSGVKLTASPAVFTVQPATVASLAGGATATVNVKFMPVAAGLVEGTLSVGELSVPLRGSGVVSPQPAIELAVRSLDFGDVPAGQRKELNLTVRNRGTATLQVSPLAVNSPVFSFRPATLSVPAGAERELTVIFAPVQTGVQTATLRIGSNDRTNSELTVALRGAGTSTPQPPAADVRMEVTPAALDFGSVPVRGAKDLSLTVRSTGAAPLTVSALAVDNPGFTVASPAAPFTVNFGSSVSVLIRFAPDRVAAFSATLTLRGNATAQPSLTIPLTGAGAAAGPRNEELKADDGSFERMVGSPGWNGDAFWVNRLTPPQYPAKLTQVRIFFPAEGDIAPNTGISLVLGTHPSGTEDVILPRMRPAIGRVSQVGKWVDFDVTLDAIESGDFVVGFYAGVDGGLKPMAQDTSRSAGRSYVSKDGTTYQKAEKAGLDGNFLIRAWVTVGQ
ncbi:MAG: choice-of-anchor D domain-containing protein, partial [Acidobacteria bacterium]|nr:choice-of-anchor D domain-containing protein [Acidobacteriota bacterium]